MDEEIYCPRCGSTQLRYCAVYLTVDYEHLDRVDGALTHNEDYYDTEYYTVDEVTAGLPHPNRSVVCIQYENYRGDSNGCGAEWPSLEALDQEVRERVRTQARDNFSGIEMKYF